MDTRQLIGRIVNKQIHDDPQAAVAAEFDNPTVGDPDARVALISIGVHVVTTASGIDILRANGDTEIEVSANAEPLTNADLDTFVANDRTADAYVLATFHAQGHGPDRHLLAIDGIRVTPDVGDDLFGRMLDCWSDDKHVTRDGDRIVAVENWWD